MLPSWMAAFSRRDTIYLRSPPLPSSARNSFFHLAHEFFHIFIESYDWQVPFWFEEGLASFFFPAPGVHPGGEVSEFYHRCEKAFGAVKEKIGEENLPSFSSPSGTGVLARLFLYGREKGKKISGEKIYEKRCPSCAKRCGKESKRKSNSRGSVFGGERREIFGLLGGNGAGKSTVIRLLLGLIAPSTGYFYVGGYRCPPLPPRAKTMIGGCLDNTSFYGNLTGIENITFLPLYLLITLKLRK